VIEAVITCPQVGTWLAWPYATACPQLAKADAATPAHHNRTSPTKTGEQHDDREQSATTSMLATTNIEGLVLAGFRLALPDLELDPIAAHDVVNAIAPMSEHVAATVVWLDEAKARGRHTTSESSLAASLSYLLFNAVP
jgi:hypothetical protein